MPVAIASNTDAGLVRGVLVGLGLDDAFTDILSGYRVMSRRFAKSFPAASSGFEIETVLNDENIKSFPFLEKLTPTRIAEGRDDHTGDPGSIDRFQILDQYPSGLVERGFVGDQPRPAPSGVRQNGQG